MKKSFKKAGAAVLSMAMLLSMGAISMPVYADNPTGATPGQVYVQISGIGDPTYKQGEGTDNTSEYHNTHNGQTGYTQSVGKDETVGSDDQTKWKYDYLTLNNVTEAKVSMYKVAKFDETGWHWNSTVFNPTSVQGFTNWETLFAKNASGEFTANSSDLQKLASYLEQNIAAAENAAAAENPARCLKVGNTETINYANGDDGVYLPNDPDLQTIDQIGYYLIVTETDQAGVIVQPVLVSLKNDASNPKKVSLKGTTISVDKKIKTVADKDEGYSVENAVTQNGKTAVVAKNDKVHYELYARMPKYDALATNITPFVLEDIADDGITIDTSTIEAYLSKDDESNMTTAQRNSSKTDNWILAEGVSGNNDYSIVSTSADLTENNADGHKNGFQFVISGAQLKGTSTGSSAGSTTGEDAKNLTGQSTMENLYLIVSFDATINEANFEKGYQADKKYADVAGDVEPTDAISAEEKEQILEVLSGQPTRYQSENVAYSNDNLIALIAESDATVTDISKAILKVTGKNVIEQDGVTALKAMTPPAYVLEGVDKTSADVQAIKAVLGTGATDDDAAKVYAILQTHYIRAKIALDKTNATLNGENNRAKLTYGNKYSTGGGSATIPTDVTTLYSVDVSFTKFSTGLSLTPKTTKSYTDGQIVTYLGSLTGTDDRAGYGATVTNPATALAALKADDGTDVDTLVATIKDDTDASRISAMLATLGVTGDTPSAEDKKAAKLALALIDVYNRDKGYDATPVDTKVVGAVFKLTKVYSRDSENPSNDQVIDLGYAVSDTDGVLKVLTANAIPSGGMTDALRETAKYVDEANGKYYTLDNNAKKAWTTLTTGLYELTEVEAPTGYQKWADPATFTITAELDSTTAATQKYTGKYTAAGTSNAYSSDGDTSETVDFKVGKDNDDNETGLLSTNIYNKPHDKLPATGGIGTVLFTAGGISVVLIAGALFVMYMKKRNAEDEE